MFPRHVSERLAGLLLLLLLSALGCGGDTVIVKTVAVPVDFKSVSFSTDGRRVAFGVEEEVKKAKDKAWVIVDGHPEKVYEDVTVVAFSPDGEHYFYGGYTMGAWYLVRDGQEITRLGNLTNLTQSTGLFETGGKMSVTIWRPLAIWFATAADNYMVIGYQDNLGGIFKDGQWLPVKFRTFNHQGMAFSPDGQHYCFAVQPQGDYMTHVYADGQPGPGFESVMSALYLQPGDRLIYAGERGGDWKLITGNQPSATMEHLVGAIIASEDGRHLATLTDMPDGQQRVIVDGREDPSFPKIAWVFEGFFTSEGSFTWNKDCTSQAYMVVAETGDAAEGENAPQAVVHNGRRLTTFPEIRGSSIVLSPDGRHVAYAARPAEKWTIVVDDIVGPTFDEVGNPVFVGPENTAVYAARQDKDWSIPAITGCGPFAGLRLLTVSPDHRHVAFAAKTAGEKWQVYLDDQPVSEPYDAIIENTGLQFEPEGTLRFVARRGNEIIWVERDIA
jgi:hypothetical protein